jgi:hypothetical protein
MMIYKSINHDEYNVPLENIEFQNTTSHFSFVQLSNGFLTFLWWRCSDLPAVWKLIWKNQWPGINIYSCIPILP